MQCNAIRRNEPQHRTEMKNDILKQKNACIHICMYVRVHAVGEASNRRKTPEQGKLYWRWNIHTHSSCAHATSTIDLRACVCGAMFNTAYRMSIAECRMHVYVARLYERKRT